MVHESGPELDYSSIDTFTVDPILKHGRDEIVNLLTTDPFVKELCGIAASRMSAQRMHRNFRRLLKIYSHELRGEAQTQIERIAALFINQSCHHIASEVQNNIAMQQATTSDYAMDLRKARLAEFILKIEGDNHDFPLTNSLSPLDPISRFLTTSTAFWNMRENLRRFLFPSAWTIYREGMRDIISHSKTKTITARAFINEDDYG
jgi:hypothetical protein